MQPSRYNLVGRVGEITPGMWHSIQGGAASRGLAFDITMEYAWSLFNGTCALTGHPIKFGTGPKRTASLDRINSKKGYVKGNVQWVHKRVNIMKGSMTDGEFWRWCARAVDHFENRTKINVRAIMRENRLTQNPTPCSVTPT